MFTFPAPALSALHTVAPMQWLLSFSLLHLLRVLGEFNSMKSFPVFQKELGCSYYPMLLPHASGQAFQLVIHCECKKRMSIALRGHCSHLKSWMLPWHSSTLQGTGVHEVALAETPALFMSHSDLWHFNGLSGSHRGGGAKEGLPGKYCSLNCRGE